MNQLKKITSCIANNESYYGTEFNDKLNILCSELKGADLVLIDMM